MKNFILPYPDLSRYRRPTPRHIDWLIRSGVPLRALTRPPMVLLTKGFIGNDGLFDEDVDGEPWLVFPQAEDALFWQPRSGTLATWNGRCFALGQDLIGAASTYAFDGCLAVFESPLDWLRSDRDGIVIVAWHRVFDELRHCPRLAVVESLHEKLKEHLNKPPRMPEIFILQQQEAVA